jgi:hypothetical protein
MLEQELVVMAAAGGTALVEAAGTDAWAGLQQAVARWFARGDARHERKELERLDRAAGELRNASPQTADRIRLRLEAAWQTRIETLLEDLDDAERAHAATQLRGLLAQLAPGAAVSAGDGGSAIGGNVTTRADHDSVAAWHMGDVSVAAQDPRRLGTPQG